MVPRRLGEAMETCEDVEKQERPGLLSPVFLGSDVFSVVSQSKGYDP